MRIIVMRSRPLCRPVRRRSRAEAAVNRTVRSGDDGDGDSEDGDNCHNACNTHTNGNSETVRNG